MRRRLRTLGRALAFAWLLLGLTLGVLIGVELLLRLGFAAKDAIRPLPIPDPRVWAEGYGKEPWVPAFFREQEALDARRAPYVEFTMAPHRGEFISIGDDGTRRVWTSPKWPAERSAKEVWLVGGSAAWGWGARDEHDLASEIAKALDRRGLSVRVRNLAQIGHVSTQEALALLLRLQAERPPDLVISYGGVNDLLVVAQGGMPGDPQNESNRAAEFNLSAHPGRLAGTLVRRLVGASAFARLAGSLAARLRIGPPAAATKGTSKKRRSPNPFDAYEANLRLMGELGERHGFRVLAYWQPDVYTKRTLVPYEREKAAQHPAIAALFPEAHRQLDLRAFHLPPNVRFRNLAHAFDDATNLIYVDFCHTTEAANVPIAETIAADIAAALEREED